jgi:hypothetical protein
VYTHHGTCLNEVRRWLEATAQRIQPFMELFSTAPPSDLAKFKMFSSFPKAWLHLLMALVFCMEQELTRFDWHVNRFDELLGGGMDEAVHSVEHGNLLESLVLTPTELALLITFQLLQDVPKTSLDISESYGEYLAGLVSPLNIEPVGELLKLPTGIGY